MSCYMVISAGLPLEVEKEVCSRRTGWIIWDCRTSVSILFEGSLKQGFEENYCAVDFLSCCWDWELGNCCFEICAVCQPVSSPDEFGRFKGHKMVMSESFQNRIVV